MNGAMELYTAEIDASGVDDGAHRGALHRRGTMDFQTPFPTALPERFRS